MIDYSARRARLQQRLKTEGIDLLAVWPNEHMDWLLGFHPHQDERPCFLFVTPADAAILMPALNADEARQHTELPMEIWADEDGADEALTRLGKRLGFGTVGTVALDETMRTDFTLLLLRHLPGADPVLATDTVGALRMRKDAAEIERIQANAATGDRAMRAALAAVRPGITEKGVAAVARAEFEKAGVDRVNFTIVGSGPNGSFPHHATGTRELNNGDAVVIDIGARMDGYNSDITRMAYVGTPDDRYLRVHDVVERAVQAALEAVRAGVRAKTIDRAARSVIEDAGFGEFFVHRTGHGLGLNGHEPPYITATSETILDEGMVFSIEPGIYLPGDFGIRLEEIVAVTASGAHVFNRLPRGVRSSEAQPAVDGGSS